MKIYIAKHWKIKEILNQHRQLHQKGSYEKSVLLGVFLIISSLLFNHFTNNYVNSFSGNYVGDIFLDNIPVFNVNFIVNELVWIFAGMVFFFSFLYPFKISFVLKSVAVFIFIRSIFIIFTHLGPIPQRSFLDSHDWLSGIASGNDMFFSGHTGMPFLMALIFWENKIIRYVCLGASLVFGTSMLMGHLHYSIDVFSAFFITYGIFHISLKIFPKDYKLSQMKKN